MGFHLVVAIGHNKSCAVSGCKRFITGPKFQHKNEKFQIILRKLYGRCVMLWNIEDFPDPLV